MIMINIILAVYLVLHVLLFLFFVLDIADNIALIMLYYLIMFWKVDFGIFLTLLSFWIFSLVKIRILESCKN